jgi:hypothetical protein
MKVRGSVRCYHCGHVSGTVQGECDGPPGVSIYYPTDGQPQRASSSIRCQRCGGPVYVDDLVPVGRASSTPESADVVAIEERHRSRRARSRSRWHGVM